MTRENLIFLGACTIMSSNPKNFYTQNLPDAEGYTYTQAERVRQAIAWSTYFYDAVHTPPEQQDETTTMEEVLGIEPARADVYIIQLHRFDDEDGKWVRSCVFDNKFATELEAERALDKWLVEKGKFQSTLFRYRVGKL